MKNILVTGAAGFIGSKTSELLLNQNFNVIGIDNMNDYYDVSVKEFRLKALQEKNNFQFHKIDIEDFEALDKLFSQNKIDGIINLAARAGVGYSLKNPFVYDSTNSRGTLNLLETMRKFEVKKLILASTSSLYAGQNMPYVETLPVNTPISPYAASKKAAEVMAYTYHYLFHFDITILRYFTVYGPAGRPDMSIFRFIQWIDAGQPLELFGDGTQSRDFTYVDDIARGTILALNHTGYDIINLGGGQNPISLNTLIHLIEKRLDKKSRINYKDFQITDMRSTWADISKAKKLLNWSPKIDLEEGINITVDWHLENSQWLKNVKL